MKDPEKRKIYDTYGSEEEIREKQAQYQTKFQYEEDMDPFDLFEMFFNGGGSFNQNVNFRHRRNQNANHQQNNEQGRANVKINRFALLTQFLPLIILFFLSVIPSLFKSVK